MAKLTSAERNAFPKEEFAIPDKRAYPIHDENHAKDTLARVSEFGPELKKRVRAAVLPKYPHLMFHDMQT